MGGEEKEKFRFSKNQSLIQLIGFGKGIVSAISASSLNFSIWASVAIAFWYGGTLVGTGEITVGDMIKVFGMMLMASLGVSMFISIIPEIGKAANAGQLLLKVIKRKPLVDSMDGPTPNTIIGNIEFKNIELFYPTRPEVKVLKNFNLVVKSGQQVALVGPSGSGKSSVVSLLERFYEPNLGSITIDGVNIKQIDPFFLHKQMAIVSQEPTLFATSLKDNILYGVNPKDVTEEDIINACKTANAWNFIQDTPRKLETQIGERGLSLSGGQKQRIAIARAVLQNPKILLLDEATSALDTESEHVVQDALNKLMKGRTTIVIAHRLSTIQSADLIVVIELGEIKETGTHNELLKIPNGVYAKLAGRQMMFKNE